MYKYDVRGRLELVFEKKNAVKREIQLLANGVVMEVSDGQMFCVCWSQKMEHADEKRKIQLLANGVVMEVSDGQMFCVCWSQKMEHADEHF